MRPANIGISYMESSSTEYVSAYVAGHIAGTPLGTTTAGTVFGPGGGPMPESFREGDYGSAVYDPGTGLFWGANEYIGSDGSTNIWRTKITSFSLVSAIGTDFYSVNANAGDNLHFATTTPAGGPLEFVNNFYPELLLYDPNGNLVAVAAGNASDGRNSVIDFTVPGGDAGKWIIEVTPSPNTPLSRPRASTACWSPAPRALCHLRRDEHQSARRGARSSRRRTIIVTFNEPVLGTSLTAGRARGQRRSRHRGHAESTPTRSTGRSIRARYATGIDLPNVGDDRRRRTWQPDHGRERPDPHRLTASRSSRPTSRPYIVSSSIDGQVFSPAPANVTEVVTFSQPMNTSFTTASSFELFGNYRNVQYAAASFSWDPTGTILTINYDNLPDDTYTLTLFAGGFENLVGHPAGQRLRRQLRRRAGHRGLHDSVHAGSAAGRPDLHEHG